MVKYATKECFACNGLFPANQMIRLHGRHQSGESVTRSHDGRHTKTTTHYTNRTSFVCTSCFGKFLKFVFITIALLVITVGVAYVMKKDNVDTTLPPQSVSDVPVALPIEQVAQPEPESLVPPGFGDPSNNNDNSAEEAGEIARTDMPGAPSYENKALDENDPIIASSLEEEIQQSLTSGEAVLWRRGSDKGYIVVSELQTATGTQCRTFYLTLIQDDQQKQSRPATRCFDESDNRWVENN